MLTKKHYYFLSFILIVFFFACISFLLEGHAYFGSNHDRDMTNLEFFLSFGVTVLSIFILFLLAHRSFHIKPKWGLVIPLGIVCLSSLISLIVFPGIFLNGQPIYSLDLVSGIRYSCLTLIVFVSLYICLAIIPSMTGGSALYDLVFLAAAVVAFAAIAWSYINETDLYGKLFSYGFPANGYNVPKSFTANRNIYGFILFYGIVGEAYLHVKRPHWWRWIVMGFVFFNQLFVLSKTSIIISVFFLGCFIVWSFVRSVFAHPYRNVISLGIVSATAIGFWLGGAFNTGGFFGWFGDYFRFAWQLFIANANHSFISRLVCYSQAYNSVTANPITALLGFGFGNWNQALYASINGSSTAFLPMDNAFAVDILENGVFGFLLSSSIWVFVFALIINALIKKRQNSWIILFLAISVLAHTMTEAGDFLYINATGTVLFCTIYLPIASDFEAEKNKVEEKEIESRYFSHPYPKLKIFSLLDASGWYFLLTPFFVLFFGLAFGFTYASRNAIFANAFLCVNVLLGFLIFPIAYDCTKTIWGEDRKNGVFAIVFLILFSISALVLPFLNVGLAGFLVPVVFLGFLMTIIISKWSLLRFSKFKNPFFLSLIFSFSLILGDNILIWLFLDSLTVYTFVCIGLIDLIAWYLFYFYQNFGSRQWDSIEDRFLYFVIKHQLKIDQTFNRETMPKIPYKRNSF